MILYFVLKFLISAICSEAKSHSHWYSKKLFNQRLHMMINWYGICSSALLMQEKEAAF